MTEYFLKRRPHSENFDLMRDSAVLQENILRRKPWHNKVYQHAEGYAGELFDAYDFNGSLERLPYSQDYRFMENVLTFQRRPHSEDYNLVFDPSCKLYLPFWMYKDPASTVYDLSGNENHGAVTGAVPTPYPLLSGVELVSNGGMETGNPPTGWVNIGPAGTFEQSAVQKHSGASSLHVVSADGFRGGQTPAYPVVAGKQYKFSYWAWLVAGASGKIYVNGVDGDGTTPIYASSNSHTAAWGYGESIFTSAVTGALSAFKFRSNNEAAEFYLDDVSVREVTGYESIGYGFDGVDDYINCGTDSTLAPTESMTLLVWFRHNKPQPTQNPRLLYKYVANECYQITLPGAATNYLNSRHSVGGVGVDTALNYILPYKQWCCIAVVRDSGTGKIYYNGVDYTIGGMGYGFAVNDPNLTIAFRSDGAYAASAVNVGEVLKINRALSAQEIRNYYELTRHIYGV